MHDSGARCRDRSGPTSRRSACRRDRTHDIVLYHQSSTKHFLCTPVCKFKVNWTGHLNLKQQQQQQKTWFWLFIKFWSVEQVEQNMFWYVVPCGRNVCCFCLFCLWDKICLDLFYLFDLFCLFDRTCSDFFSLFVLPLRQNMFCFDLFCLWDKSCLEMFHLFDLFVFVGQSMFWFEHFHLSDTACLRKLVLKGACV